MWAEGFWLSETLDIGSEILKSEGYTNDLGLKEVQLKFIQSEIKENRFVLHQNVPNPFEVTTRISFELPEDSEATISIYDLTGRRVYTMSGQFVRGYNEVELHKDDIKGSGILFYEIMNNELKATRKMLLLAKE